MNAPPGNEKAARQGRSLKTDDEGKIEQTPATCKKQFPDWPPEVATPKKLESDRKIGGEPLAPAGYGHVYAADGSRELVPVELPPDFTPEEKQRLDIILPVLRWVGFSKARMAALEFLGGLDRRTVSEIARTHKISASVVHREVKRLRAFIGAMRP